MWRDRDTERENVCVSACMCGGWQEVLDDSPGPSHEIIMLAEDGPEHRKLLAAVRRGVGDVGGFYGGVLWGWGWLDCACWAY